MNLIFTDHAILRLKQRGNFTPVQIQELWDKKQFVLFKIDKENGEHYLVFVKSLHKFFSLIKKGNVVITFKQGAPYEALKIKDKVFEIGKKSNIEQRIYYKIFGLNERGEEIISLGKLNDRTPRTSKFYFDLIRRIKKHNLICASIKIIGNDNAQIIPMDFIKKIIFGNKYE